VPAIPPPQGVRETAIEVPVRGFRPDIQGLRAVAVLLVVLYHVNAPLIHGGYVGVDVFFVISGFLMTGRLARSLDQTGRPGLGAFYASRVRRILPAALVVLVITLVASMFIVTPLRLFQIGLDAIATALYVPNIYFAIQGTSYLGAHDPSPFQHYWSLGVEEQFYLVWPLLLGGLWIAVKGRSARVTAAIALVSIASLAWCVLQTTTSQPWAFFSLQTRAWEFGAGAIVAIVLRHRTARASVRSSALAWLGLAMIAAAGLGFDDTTLFPGIAAGLPVAGTALVIAFGATGSRGGPERLLGLRPFRFFGDISYSLYLWHWPILILAAIAAGGVLPRWLGFVLAVVTVPVAYVTTRYIEVPLRKSPRIGRLPARRTILIGGVAALVLAVAGASTSAVVYFQPAARSAPAAAAVPTPYPVFAETVPINVRPNLLVAHDDIPSVFSNNCMHGDPQNIPQCIFGDPTGTRTWVMFGDSHMANWMPALSIYAQAHQIRLVIFGKTSCPVADVMPYVNAAPFTECVQWRTRVLPLIAQEHPEVIVMSSSRSTAIVDDSGAVVAAPDPHEIALYAAGLGRTLGAFPTTSRVVFIADTPYFPTAPASCLTAHPQAAALCSSARSTALDPTWNRAVAGVMAAEHEGFLDMSDYLCDRTTCGAIIGNVLLYSDLAHVSQTASLMLAPAFGRQLDDALAGVTP
jgi:peptidoglycan/LPS O-acetylase OafA/YrhL